eukprot:GHRR01007035.1.p2 GENE.GHRR01007035.1~~GHRR01007035.1.p2  ORF type:complete len:132 (+),score=43.19 GHRR01007035.1:1962-2357(+)
MVRDLDFPIKVLGMPIAREPDGLAMSSRNARLSPESRKAALSISAALNWAMDAVMERKVTQPKRIVEEVKQQITAAGGQVDYVELRDADNLQPITDLSQQRTLLAVATWFPAKGKGTVRLIDNTVLEPLKE